MEDEFESKMAEKVGIDKSTARKVVDFLKEHSDEAIKALKGSGLKEKLPGGIGKML